MSPRRPDDFSRYIIAWKLCTTMKAEDVTATLEMALHAAGLDKASVLHRHEMAPRSSPQARTRHRLPAGAKYEKAANRITQASENGEGGCAATSLRAVSISFSPLLFYPAAARFAFAA